MSPTQTIRSPRLRTAVALCVLLAGCGGGDTPKPQPPPKVVLIGWDGATWDVIRPMIDHGELPVLSGLLERGGRAVLQAVCQRLGSSATVQNFCAFLVDQRRVIDLEAICQAYQKLADAAAGRSVETP